MGVGEMGGGEMGVGEMGGGKITGSALFFHLPLPLSWSLMTFLFNT